MGLSDLFKKKVVPQNADTTPEIAETANKVMEIAARSFEKFGLCF